MNIRVALSTTSPSTVCKWRNALRSTFKEGIDDGEPADGAAVPHVLAVEDMAAGLDRGGDDQRIVEGQLVILGKHPCREVHVKRERQRRIDHREYIGNRLGDCGPIPTLLASRDGRELVQHL